MTHSVGKDENLNMKIRKLICVLLAAALVSGVPADGSSEKGNTVSGAMLQNPTASAESGEAGTVDFSFASPEEMLGNMKAVSENNRFILYYSKNNLSVALLEKSSGRIYSTNPYNGSVDESNVGNVEKSLESQVIISYIDVNERQQKLDMYSSADCVELGQFSYTEYADGVSFDMSLGKESGIRLVPAALTEARFNEITSKLEGRPVRRMNGFYTKYSLDDAESEEEKKDLLSQYPGLKNGAVYATLSLSEKETEEVEGYLREIGYTAEDLKNDLAAVGIETEKTESPNFKLTLEYVLTEDGLTVNIPNEKISYDDENYQLLSLRLLPFFGCDEPQQNGEGYLFFPDGSGSVIEMNGLNENRRLITTAVYGFDAGDELDADTRSEMPCYFPVFGIQRNNGGSFLAIIESGDEVASVTAQLGEPNSRYYTVYGTFTVANEKHVQRDAKVSSLGSKQMIYLFEKGRTPYSGNLTVGYHILSGGNSGYSGMAACYRSYLMSCGMTEKELAQAGIAIETLGTALYPADFLGFTYDAQAEFTAYNQNISIMSELLDSGVENLSVQLSGWQKNGLDAGISNKVRLSNALGGKKDFKKLLGYAADNDISLYPDADLLFVTKDRLFDGFSSNTAGIRQLDYTMGGIAEFKPDIDDFGTLRTGVSPAYYAKYFNSFFKSASSLGISSISLGTAGSYLNSDYNRQHGSNRGETRKTLEKLLKTYSKNYSLSFSGANAYVLPYADRLSDIAMTDSGYLKNNYSVPFVQMAVSGCAVLQSPSINLEQNIEEQILRCIENGTQPKFTVCSDNIELLKQTDYNRYCSVSFEVQKDNILKAYRQYTEAMSVTDNSAMVSHARLTDGVFVSVYANGAKIYVNYNGFEYVKDGITIPAEGFAAISGKA